MDIAYIRELTKQEVDAYLVATSTIASYKSYKFAPRMVYENDEQFFTTMQDCLRNYFIDTSKPELLEEYTFIANKALLNYLSSVRFFTEFVQTKLARQFSKNSEQLKEFRASLSASFDTSFAYRFFYKFRNYVQHCGHAVGTLEIRARPGNLGNASLTIFCSAETLLKDYNEWGKVTFDL